MTNVQVTWSERIPYLNANVKNVKEDGGVYKLIRKTTDGGFGVFYIGMTTKLRTRLDDHLSDNEDNDCIKKKLKNSSCYFRYAYISKQETRECAEAFLYKKYEVDGNGPPCNKKKPEADPCEINLT